LLVAVIGSYRGVLLHAAANREFHQKYIFIRLVVKKLWRENRKRVLDICSPTKEANNKKGCTIIMQLISIITRASDMN